MASDNLLELTEQNFPDEVEQSNQPVLVDFWAEWCQPCRMLAPTIEEIAGEYQGRVKVGKLDTDANRDLALKYNINAIPTVMLFNNGEVVQTFTGVKPKEDITAELDKVAS